MANAGEENRRYNRRISEFLETFPNKLNWKVTNESYSERRVFWTQDNHNNNNTESTTSTSLLQEKIISAFCDVNIPRLTGLLQFWAPVETETGRKLLSSSKQPFALEDFDPRHHDYRICSQYHQCSFINDDHKPERFILPNSTVATAFFNLFPEVILDLRHEVGDIPTLVDKALDCEFTSQILLPVFDPSSQDSSCVGVVECTMKVAYLFIVLSEVKSALERAGLSTYHIKECLPYKSINGLKHATYEIEEALKIVCESHQLNLGQVWIANESANHVPCSSTLEDTRTKQKLLLRLTGYCCYSLEDHVADPHEHFYYPHYYPMCHIQEYYDTCDVLALKMGDGLVGKTFETYEPHFCRNLAKLKVKWSLGLLAHMAKSSCLAICLRSTHTGDNVDYAFEFLWPHSRNYLIVLESVLSTLKRCLPNFKFASGEELGGELRIVDVEDSTQSGVGFIEALKGNSLPKPLEQGKVNQDELKLQHESSTVKEAARNLNGQVPYSLKRKFTDLSEIEDENDSDPFWDDDVDLLVLTCYKEQSTVILFRSSYILEDAMERIEEEFNLEPDTYTLEYESDGKWFKLDTEENLAILRERYRTSPKCRLNVCATI